MPQRRVRLEDLAQRTSFALRNHLGNLITLAHVLEAIAASDPDAVAALREAVSHVALDADLLVDLALASADYPEGDAPLRDLLREAARPFDWLADALGGRISVVCPIGLEARYIAPREIVATGRRLLAALIARGMKRPLVLEARRVGDGILVAARPSDLQLVPSRLVDAPPVSNANDMHVEVLDWVLARPELGVRHLASPDGTIVAVLLTQIGANERRS
jgi:hypothetical protein